MAGKISDNDDEPISDINIVPFVDIILVVLIIFMVTTPLIMDPSISVNLPEAISGDDTAPSEFSVAITAEGEVLLNGKPSSAEQINQQAKIAFDQNPMVQAIIAADKVVSHGQVVKIIDAVKSGGIKKFAITIDKN